ncbi:hypothetical protein V1515DRAFT_476260 [Lipomyces mesembrius]
MVYNPCRQCQKQKNAEESTEVSTTADLRVLGAARSATLQQLRLNYMNTCPPRVPELPRVPNKATSRRPTRCQATVNEKKIMPKRKSRDLEAFQNGHGCLDVLRKTFAKIYSLHDFLQQHVSDEVLLLPDDSEKYALVLKTSVVGIHDEAVLRAASRFRAGEVTITPSSGKIKEVLDIVVTELLSKSRRGMSQNIITLGFSKNNTEGTTALTSTVQEYASSHYMALCAAEWQLLLERIGDSAMIFLLTSTCVFFEFGNQSYYQAVGFPIYDIKGQKDRWQTKRPSTKNFEKASIRAVSADTTQTGEMPVRYFDPVLLSIKRFAIVPQRAVADRDIV